MSDSQVVIKKVRESDLHNNNLPYCLKVFAGCSLTLAEYVDTQGRDIVEDGFCAAVVKYYAKYSKPRQPGGNLKAQQALQLIEQLGMRVFIHQKTGWKSQYYSPIGDEFDQELNAHKERFTIRQIVKIEDHPELMFAVQEWQKKHHSSRKIFADTNDTLNECLQGMRAKEIKQHNNLPKSAAIRDHYDTRPLMNYSVLMKLAANQIRYHNIHPVEAVHKGLDLYMPKHKAELIPVIENIKKADKRLKAEDERRRLAAGVQLSLPLGL
ncbi:MAG: hypothetical protein HEQ26_03690 [Dolichospermum sp. DL01]|nr:MAG: hypothetical protein HEQ26_03690 [Dolichospermum sp. DL01]